MTVLNFPSPSASPYEVNGVRYTWDGEAWVAAGGVRSAAHEVGCEVCTETQVNRRLDLAEKLCLGCPQAVLVSQPG